MSRSVFANTIGDFILDGIPSQVTARSNNLGFLDVDALVERGKEAGKEIIVETVEDTVDSALQSAGLTSGQQQQPTSQGVNFAAATPGLVSVPQALMQGRQIQASTVAQAQGVLEAQKRVRQAQALAAAQKFNQQQQGLSQATGQTSQVTEDPKKEEKKKPFFKTGAGIATILVGAAAIAGGIVYFATQE